MTPNRDNCLVKVSREEKSPVSCCRKDHAYMDVHSETTCTPPADAGSRGWRWLMDEGKWRLAAIFQEINVNDGWKMKKGATNSYVTLGFLMAWCRMAACVCFPLRGELRMRLRSGPNMHCHTSPAGPGGKGCFNSKATPSS